MLRKKLCKILAAVMVATTVLGGNVSRVSATEVDEAVIEMNSNTIVEDGKYQASNYTYKTDTDTESKSREYVEDITIIDVNDGKITMTIKYTEKGLKYITATTVKVDGSDMEVVENEDKSITFQVVSIDSKIQVGLNVTVPEMNFSHVVSFDLVNDMDTIEKISDASSDSTEDDSNGNNGSGNNTEDNDDNADNNNDNSTGNGDVNSGGNNNNNSNNGSNNETNESLESKNYTIKNEVSHENATGLDMARKALEEVSKVEVINGKYYVTLNFTSMGSNMMDNHEIYVNGNIVNATKVANGNNISLRFAIGQLEDEIKVSAFVDMMGANVEFGVNLLKDTLTLVSEENDNNSGTTDDSVNDSTGGTTNNGATNNDSTSNSGNTSNDTTENTTTTEEEVKVTKGKLYSIQNKVVHESETGLAMARKYLNATSMVEEVEGKYYVTLTFTGAEFMQNHEIYINGEKVFTTKSANGDEISIRFAVSSLSNSIKVSTFIVPMDRNVEFGVELLQDTLTFIKDYTVEYLPNTGAATSSAAVAGIGALLSTAGVFLSKKKKVD